MERRNKIFNISAIVISIFVIASITWAFFKFTWPLTPEPAHIIEIQEGEVIE